MTYLKVDVVGLAAVFEEFRHQSMANFSLDPPHYVTGPSLFWDATLLMLPDGVNLGYIKDLTSLDFWENHKRGGVAQISQRKAVVGEKGVKSITCFDVNSSYGGFCMQQSLPIEDGRQMSLKELKNWRKLLHQKEGEETYGCSLVVDLHFPRELIYLIRHLGV